MPKVAASAPPPVADEKEGLKSRHHELERQIAALDRHLALTSNEQLERARLKKEKLWVKDRLAALAQDGRGMDVGSDRGAARAND